MKYQAQLDEISSLIRSSQRSEDAQARVVMSLKKYFPKFNWVGIFRFTGRELVLGPYQGKVPAGFEKIPVGRGVCGTVAVTMRTEVVPDVAADARYLTCFDETRSELVVPIIKGDKLWGEITIDAREPNAFTRDEIELIEKTSQLLSEVV
ncbi:MAG: GAF domain-containing protein [candidate division WOR-3 bacterium]|jgi:GAF domain-containing protein